MRFSQRMGLEPGKKILQKDSMDDDLRNRLWNFFHIKFINKFDYFDDSEQRSRLLHVFWAIFLKKPIDEQRDLNNIQEKVKDHFLNAEWNRVYDLLEFLLYRKNYIFGYETPDDYDTLNIVLKSEDSAYRFVAGILTPIVSNEEIESIEDAIKSSTPYGGAPEHLKKALEHLSDRKNPDYANSIKESISGVEAIAKVILDDKNGTLGQLLKKLENQGIVLPAQKEAFSKLYGYCSNEHGIRHAKTSDSPPLGQTEALYYLVICSAFINYMINKVGVKK